MLDPVRQVRQRRPLAGCGVEAPTSGVPFVGLATVGAAHHRVDQEPVRDDPQRGRLVLQVGQLPPYALLAKLDGLSERDLRWPMTPTGTNLLGLVKHLASVQLGYFGEVFGRSADRALPWFDEGAEVNADMWATAEESRDEIMDLHLFAAAHTDAMVEALDLDSPGLVSWWPPERQRVTLHQIQVPYDGRDRSACWPCGHHS
jgi:hypothetical protein